MRAVSRTVVLWGAFMLAVLVSSLVSAWWVAILLIAAIFTATAIMFANRH